MKITGFKYLLSLIVTHITIICVAQNNVSSNLESAIQYMQNGDFKSSLNYIETYLNTNNSTDDEAYFVACYVGGTSAHLMGDYQRSRSLLDKIINTPDLPEDFKIHSLCYQITNLMELSLGDDCIPIINELYELYKTTRSIDALYTLIYYYSNIQNYEGVLDLEKYLTSISVPENPNDISEITTISQLHGIYMNLASAYYHKEDWNNSLKYWQKSLETIIDNNQDRYSLICTYIADTYGRLGDRKNALKYQEFASNGLPLSDIHVPDDVRNIIRIFNQYELSADGSQDDRRFEAIKLLNNGVFLTMNEHFTDAYNALEKALKLFDEIGEYDYYYYSLNWLCHVYRQLGNVAEYNVCKDKIANAVAENKIANSTIRLYILSKYSDILSSEGELDEAIRIAESSLKDAIKLYGEFDINTFSFYYQLCSLYLERGELDKCEDLIITMKSLDFKSQSDRIDYYSAILLEGYWMRDLGRIGEMIQLLERVATEIQTNQDLLGIKSDLYSALGAAYASLGNFPKAKSYDEKSLEIDKILYGENSPYYATTLVNLSEMYAINGMLDKSIEMILKASDIFDKLYGKNNAKYIECLQKLAGRYAVSNPIKSKELYKDCSSLWETLYGRNSKEYAECLIYSNLDFSLNPNPNSIINVKEGLDTLRSLGYNTEEFYQGFLSFYCTMLFAAQDYNNLYLAASDLLETIRNYIYYNFLIMPESQRESLWSVVKQKINGIEQYAADYSNYAVANKDYALIKDYSGLGYNARLLKKGLLLTSSRNIENAISNLNNPKIDLLIKEISTNRSRLSSMTSDSEEYEKVERTINNLERDLLKLIADSGDFMKFTTTKWQDIQDALMPGEVAIEFFSYPCQDDKQYGMSFVGSDGTPVTCTLFMESELNDFLNDDITTYDYQDPGLYKTIWSASDVFSEIRNAHTIYFSADGKLNIIAVENLCDSTGLLASEKRNIIRLSSTRELLNRYSHSSELSQLDCKNKVVLYGGLDYNADLSTPHLNDPNKSSTMSSPTAVQVAQRAFNNRAEYLQGTLKEVELLSQQMRNSNVNLYTGSDGTELSVIEMANSNPNLLHIATHGFYFDDSLNNYSSNGTEQISTESRAMQESGLLFSGANHKLLGQRVENESNDGILTAQEISNISLLNTDLVVLSACETGLGSISDEGIFGLQRGFKLSGVNSIIMALWKVDDDATKELMNSFYISLLSGSSKVEALRDAQERIRKTPGYEDPEYWAAFILLDALN